MHSENFDITAITETGLSNNIFTNKILSSCNSVLREDCDSRGGVLLALKSSLTTMQLPSPSDLEIVLAEIDPDLLVCLIYRPPNLTDQYNSSLLTYLNSLDGTKNTVLMGDLNFPEIDRKIYSGNSPTADDFAKVVYGLNLTQCITGPTHCARNTLDIVLSNISGLHHTDTCTNFPPNLTSDHYLLKVLIINHVFNKPTKTRIQRFDYNNANW